MTPWTQDVNWTYKRRSEDVLDVFWMSYIRSICVLCPRGGSVRPFSTLWKSSSLEEYERARIIWLKSFTWINTDFFNPLSANLQNGQTHSNNCLSVFDHFVGLVLKGLMLSFLVFNKKLLICVETERERERERESSVT